MQCLILAGGLGTRMLPLTESIPKALLPVNGIPFLHHQLTHLAKTGVKRVVISVGHFANQIQEYAGDGGHWGLEIRYSNEGEKLRGTGGALRLAYDLGLLEDRFLLTYGDSYLPVDFSGIFRKFETLGGEIAMCVYENNNAGDQSNVIYQAPMVKVYDKRNFDPAMKFIDYGLLGVKSSFVAERLAPGEASDFSQTLHAVSKEGGLFGIEVTERFHEIGSPEGLRSLEAHLK